MNRVIDFVKKNESKCLWFIVTFTGGILPILIRLALSIDLNINAFDIKDFLFAALAFNIANFNLVTSKKLPLKIVLCVGSAMVIAFIGIILGVFYAYENNSLGTRFYSLNTLSVLLFIGSAYMSYYANKIVFSK
ncbi:hypothetical protein LX64_04727 [Chitinophaga skermanii]|uniref:Uncharacterized protein n=1 Tax=Chitinophaga skermanii TaxID=331697 RepID=A0A327Q6B9_9BACT|nr:hypothetical protein [Chitinophaga skermanii]RAI98742.1 hypothetical protein LX64_04727 [Chitinophaga skermanii]